MVRHDQMAQAVGTASAGEVDMGEPAVDPAEAGDAVISPQLARPTPLVTVAEACTVAGKLYGLEIASGRALPSERDSNFCLHDVSGREFVLKLLHPDEEPALTSFQTGALLHVAAVDPSLPIPRVVEPLHGDTADAVWTGSAQARRRVRCVTYMRGRPMYQSRPSVSQLRNLGTVLARLDLALSGYRHPGEDHELFWDLKRADRVRGLLAAIPDSAQRDISEQVLDRFARDVKPKLSTLRCQTLHNDMNRHNVLVSEDADQDVVAIIDFGDMVRGPLVQDLATASAYQSLEGAHPLRAAAELAAAFHAIHPLEDGELAVLLDLMLTRLALSAAISSWRAARHPDNAPYILRNAHGAWMSLRRLEGLPHEDAVAWLNDQITRS
jgi:Ser/Thr protein kinase RdoA (MazF antagonist)